MNNALRYSMSAVFTSLATTYFIGVGIVRLAQAPPSPPISNEIVPTNPGTDLARNIGVRDDLFKPLVAVPDPNEAMWRSVKSEQTEIKSQVANQLATLLRVEEEWRGSNRKVESISTKLAESERLTQETKNALEAAQIRIGKMEGALKVAQDRELKATMTAKRMVKMFTTMSPEKAAKILEELPNGETADLLARMKEAEAAAILTLFPPKRAAALSARLGGNRGGPP